MGYGHGYGPKCGGTTSTPDPITDAAEIITDDGVTVTNG